MRIAVNTISTKKNSGGALQIAYNFLMETLKHQEDADWYYITSSDVDELVGRAFEPLYGIRYFVFPTQPDFRGSYRRVKRELANWESKHAPDVVYTISSPCYFKFKTKEVMRFANAWVTNPTKEAWQVMPWKAWLRMRLYRLNQIRLLRGAECLITQSETVKKGLLRITGLPENRVKVIPNVLPQVFADAKVELCSDPEWVDIISVAAPVPHKNLDIIPGVLKCLKVRHGVDNVRFHLTIPEDNPLYKRIADECEVQGMQDRIVNHGRCSQQQLCEIYNHVDLCFLPTLLETFSASSLEAMHFGLPIVASDFSFNKEVIGDAGLYYKPMCAEDAAWKISSIINDEDVRGALTDNMKGRIQLYNDYRSHFMSIMNYLRQVSNGDLG